MKSNYDDIFYTTPTWRRLRKRILLRDKYTDQILKRYGRIEQADIVHHIFPREDYPEFAYEEWNLISITRKTHESLHDRNTNELTSKGIDLLVRTCKRLGMEVPNVYKEKIKERRRTTKPKPTYYIK